MIPPKPAGKAGATLPVLELINVGHGFGANPCELFREVNLQVCRGEVVAIRGDNGSGKSTLLRLPLGLVQPRAGKVLLEGKQVSAANHMWQIAYVGSLPQEDGALPLPPGLPVHLYTQTILQALRVTGADVDFAREMADLLGLNSHHVRGKQIGQLSKGWQARHLWWAAIAKPATLMLLDEPFDGLDDEVKQLVFNLLPRAVARHNAGVIVVSHHFHEMVRLADRVFELKAGRLNARGEEGFRAVVTADGHDRLNKILSGKDLLDVLADSLLGGRVTSVSVSASAIKLEQEVA